MKQLAETIRNKIKSLAKRYSQRLQKIQGYTALSRQNRLDSARETLELVAACLEAGDDAPFVQLMQARVDERRQQGIDLEALLQALTALEELLQPLVEDVEEATFLWRMFAASRTIASQRTLTVLQESEDKLRLLYESMSDAVMLLDENGFFDCNQATLAMFGCMARDQFVGQHPGQFSPRLQPNGESSDSLSREHIDAALREGSRRFEWQHCRLDGAEFPAEVTLTAVDIDGQKALQAIVHDLTDRKLTEQRLSESQQMLQLIMDNIPQSIFWKDKDLVYLGCNRNFALDTGLDSPEAVIGKTDYDMPWTAQAELYRADDQDVIASGTAKINFEEPQTTPAGEQIWQRTSKVPLQDDRGRTWAVLGMYEDVTDRKRAEDALRESESKFRVLFEKSVDALLLIDGGKFIDCNSAAVKMMRSSAKEDLLSLSPSEISPERQPDGRLSSEKEAELIQIALERGSHRFEWVHRRVDGQNFPVEVTLTAVPLEGRQILYTAWRDITERKRAEIALQDSEAALRSIFNSTHDAIFLHELDGTLTDVNDKMLEMYGVDRSQAFELSILEDYSSSDNPLEDLPRFWEKVVAGEDQLFEWIARRPGDGSTFEVEVFLTRVTLGDRGAILATVSDISPQKHLERQLQGSLERRGRQVQLSTQLAQDISMASDLRDLYRRVVNLVQEQFGYYYVQLLRYDPAADAVMMVAGSGQLGEQMQAQGHRMRLGEGLIGTAAATGAPVLRSDVRADPNWRSNPLLPETRGELAVPIKFGRENAEAQIWALQNFVEGGFDGAAIASLDVAAVAPVAGEAVRRGHPVVAISTDLGEENQTALVLAAEYDMGYMLGTQAGEWAKEHIPTGQILKLGVLNYRFVPQVAQREKGIVDGLKAVFGGAVEIVGRETAGDPMRGRTITEVWLAEHPDLAMVVGINDGGALGAYQAARAAGRNDPDAFFIGGIDAVDEALRAIKSGGIYQASVDQTPGVMGILALRTLIAAIKGVPYQKVNTIDCTPVNRSNVDEFLNAERRAATVQKVTLLEQELAGLDLRGLRLGLSVLSLTNPFFVELVEAAEQEAERLGVQLVINDPRQILGVLDVQSETAGALDQDDQLVLEGLCGQIAIAIESTQLRQEMEDNLRELRAVQRAMSREGWTAFRETGKLPGGYLFDRTGMHPAEELWLPEMELAAAQKTLVSPAPVLSEKDDTSGERKKDFAAVAPMLVQDEMVGLLGVYDDPQRPLSADDLALVESVSAQVAQALESARLFEQTQDALAEARALYHFGEVLSREADLQAIYKAVARLVVDELGYASSGILVLDEEGQALQGVAGAGISDEITRLATPLSEAHNPLAITALNRQTVVINEPAQDEQVADMPKETKTTVGKLISAPILVGGKLVGVIAGSRSLADADIDERDERLIQAAATQAAVAIQRAQLFTQTQEALALAENLYETGQRISAADDLEEVVEAVAEGAALPVILRVTLFVFERNAADEIETIEVAANWHSGQGRPPFPVGTNISRSLSGRMDILTPLEPLVFGDIENDDRLEPAILEILRRQNVRSMVTLPLWVGPRQVGVLILEAEDLHDFTEREMQPYLALAPQVAVAVDNQRLLNETRTALAEVETTQRRYTVQAWESYLTRRAALSYEQVREGVSPLGDQLPPEAGQAVELKRTAITSLSSNGQQQTPDTNGQNSAAKRDSSLVAPLTLRGEVIGVLGLQETDAREWSPEEIALVEEICEQVSQAAEGLRLLDETQQRAAREARVNEIGDKIQSAQSLEEALQIAIQEVGRSLRAPQTAVQLKVE